MKLLIALACLLSATMALADYHLIDLQEVSVDAIQFFDGGNDPLITWNGLHHNVDKQIDLNINLKVSEVLYWDNKIHSMTDSNPAGGGQFRLIGWNFRFGVTLSEYLQVGYYHFSQHLLDYQLPGGAFPVLDGIEVRWKLYTK